MWLIERYVWRAIVPYFALAWLLLTTVLFLQQSSRFAELFFGGKVPASLLVEIGIALLPNVIAFTGPLAILAGIVIGFGRLQGDSELVAMRAAGIATWRLVTPCLILGFLLTLGAFYVNFRSIPEASKVLRRVALQALIYKTESPVEPGVFTTEIPNYVIYVKEGNRADGTWAKVFLYSQAKDGNTRLITAGSGRIDTAKEQAELVLQDATVTTLNLLVKTPSQSVAVERVAELRVALETQRRELLKRLQTLEPTPEELGLQELAAFAETKTGKEKLEANLLFQRRVTLAIAPLVIAWLGIGLSLRFGRGGRGWSTILAFLSAIAYYAVALLGEQLARSGILTPFFGVWLATFGAILLGTWWLWNTRGGVSRSISLNLPEKLLQSWTNRTRRRFNLPFFGILERDLWLEIGRYFLLAVASLTSLYLIFTIFELWKFVGVAQNGKELLFKYLVFLAPLVIWQVAPSALMIAVLATYAIKTRRGEMSAWWAAGQSVYRLLAPGLLFAAVLGMVAWELQERILPTTNRMQDALRSQLRSGGTVGEQNGRFWVADGNRIYSFTTNREIPSNTKFRDVTVYEFAPDGIRLEAVKRGTEAIWENSGKIELTGNIETITWQKSFVNIEEPQNLIIETAQITNPFAEIITKTSHLDSAGLRKNLEMSESETEKRVYRVALQKKYATLFIPLVIAFFSIPFALSFGRRGTTLSLAFAFGSWLIFTGISVFFERLGESGFLRAELAIWSPLVLFMCFGLFLLSRAKT